MLTIVILSHRLTIIILPLQIVYTNLVDRSAVSARLSTREAQTVGIHHPLGTYVRTVHSYDG